VEKVRLAHYRNNSKDGFMGQVEAKADLTGQADTPQYDLSACPGFLRGPTGHRLAASSTGTDGHRLFLARTRLPTPEASRWFSA